MCLMVSLLLLVLRRGARDAVGGSDMPLIFAQVDYVCREARVVQERGSENRFCDRFVSFRGISSKTLNFFSRLWCAILSK